MPWRQEAMKDVALCDKPVGRREHPLIPGCPNGETHLTVCYCRVATDAPRGPLVRLVCWWRCEDSRQNRVLLI